ncbi:MAG: DUF4214 domain-containing protein [Saccharofermentans sp.]|nr:DUF4214 domain-containing protein [Saccharofermentans sp.]
MRFKKFVASFLAAAMVFPTIAMNVFADEGDEDIPVVVEEGESEDSVELEEPVVTEEPDITEDQAVVEGDSALDEIKNYSYTNSVINDGTEYSMFKFPNARTSEYVVDIFSTTDRDCEAAIFNSDMEIIETISSGTGVGGNFWFNADVPTSGTLYLGVRFCDYLGYSGELTFETNTYLEDINQKSFYYRGPHSYEAVSVENLPVDWMYDDYEGNFRLAAKDLAPSGYTVVQSYDSYESNIYEIVVVPNDDVTWLEVTYINWAFMSPQQVRSQAMYISDGGDFWYDDDEIRDVSSLGDFVYLDTSEITYKNGHYAINVYVMPKNASIKFSVSFTYNGDSRKNIIKAVTDINELYAYCYENAPAGYVVVDYRFDYENQRVNAVLGKVELITILYYDYATSELVTSRLVNYTYNDETDDHWSLAYEYCPSSVDIISIGTPVKNSAGNFVLSVYVGDYSDTRDIEVVFFNEDEEYVGGTTIEVSGYNWQNSFDLFDYIYEEDLPFGYQVCSFDCDHDAMCVYVNLEKIPLGANQAYVFINLYELNSNGELPENPVGQVTSTLIYDFSEEDSVYIVDYSDVDPSLYGYDYYFYPELTPYFDYDDEYDWYYLDLILCNEGDVVPATLRFYSYSPDLDKFEFTPVDVNITFDSSLPVEDVIEANVPKGARLDRFEAMQSFKPRFYLYGNDYVDSKIVDVTYVFHDRIANKVISSCAGKVEVINRETYTDYDIDFSLFPEGYDTTYIYYEMSSSSEGLCMDVYTYKLGSVIEMNITYKDSATNKVVKTEKKSYDYKSYNYYAVMDYINSNVAAESEGKIYVDNIIYIDDTNVLVQLSERNYDVIRVPIIVTDYLTDKPMGTYEGSVYICNDDVYGITYNYNYNMSDLYADNIAAMWSYIDTSAGSPDKYVIRVIAAPLGTIDTVTVKFVTDESCKKVISTTSVDFDTLAPYFSLDQTIWEKLSVNGYIVNYEPGVVYYRLDDDPGYILSAVPLYVDVRNFDNPSELLYSCESEAYVDGDGELVYTEYGFPNDRYISDPIVYDPATNSFTQTYYTCDDVHIFTVEFNYVNYEGRVIAIKNADVLGFPCNEFPYIYKTMYESSAAANVPAGYKVESLKLDAFAGTKMKITCECSALMDGDSHNFRVDYLANNKIVTVEGKLNANDEESIVKFVINNLPENYSYRLGVDYMYDAFYGSLIIYEYDYVLIDLDKLTSNAFIDCYNGYVAFVDEKGNVIAGDSVLVHGEEFDYNWLRTYSDLFVDYDVVSVEYCNGPIKNAGALSNYGKGFIVHCKPVTEPVVHFVFFSPDGVVGETSVPFSVLVKKEGGLDFFTVNDLYDYAPDGYEPTLRHHVGYDNLIFVPVKSTGVAPTPTPDDGLVPMEEGGVDAFCARLYTEALGRSLDPAGAKAWADAIRGGADGAKVAHGFFFSAELEAKKLSDEEFVARLYKTFMDREADPAGLNAWVQALKKGATREQVFNGFINSQEWANVCFKYGIKSGGSASPNIRLRPTAKITSFAERLYTTCLGRSADPAGLKAWAEALANREGSGAKVAYGFFFSAELEAQKLSDEEFVRRCYLTFMDREPDPAGFNSWVKALKDGATREQVFNGFTKSPEFVNLCEQAGIIAYD